MRLQKLVQHLTGLHVSDNKTDDRRLYTHHRKINILYFLIVSKPPWPLLTLSHSPLTFLRGPVAVKLWSSSVSQTKRANYSILHFNYRLHCACSHRCTGLLNWQLNKVGSSWSKHEYLQTRHIKLVYFLSESNRYL